MLKFNAEWFIRKIISILYNIRIIGIVGIIITSIVLLFSGNVYFYPPNSVMTIPDGTSFHQLRVYGRISHTDVYFELDSKNFTASCYSTTDPEQFCYLHNKDITEKTEFIGKNVSFRPVYESKINGKMCISGLILNGDFISKDGKYQVYMLPSEKEIKAYTHTKILSVTIYKKILYYSLILLIFSWPSLRYFKRKYPQ